MKALTLQVNLNKLQQLYNLPIYNCMSYALRLFSYWCDLSQVTDHTFVWLVMCWIRVVQNASQGKGYNNIIATCNEAWLFNLTNLKTTPVSYNFLNFWICKLISKFDIPKVLNIAKWIMFHIKSKPLILQKYLCINRFLSLLKTTAKIVFNSIFNNLNNS